MRFNEGISQPGDAEDADAGAHPGLKGAGVEHFAGVDFAGDANQGGDGQHKYHDRLVTRQHRVLNQADGIADGRGVEHHRHDADQKQQDRAFGVRLQLKYLAAAQSDFPLGQPLLVNRIVFQFAAEEVADDSGEHHRQQRDRNTDGQQRQIANAQRFKDSCEKDHCGGNGRGGDRYLGGHHRNRQWTRRTNALLFGNFGDHRQRGEGGMAGASEHGHKPGHQRGKEGNVLRVAAQHPFGEADQVIHPAGDLHGGDSGNHRHNDFNNVEGDRTRFNLKNKRQDKDAKATGKADTDAAEPGAEINRQQDNNQFCTKHICLPCFLTS